MGSFHTSTIHGMSGSTWVSETGCSTSAGAVEARRGVMRPIVARLAGFPARRGRESQAAAHGEGRRHSSGPPPKGNSGGALVGAVRRSYDQGVMALGSDPNGA